MKMVHWSPLQKLGRPGEVSNIMPWSRGWDVGGGSGQAGGDRVMDDFLGPQERWGYMAQLPAGFFANKVVG